MFKSTISNLYSFSKNPTEDINKNQSVSFKLKAFITILLLNVFLMIVIGFAIQSLMEYFGIKQEEHAIAKALNQLPFGIIFLMGCVFIPFLEEIIFRLPLLYKNNYLLKIFVFILTEIGITKKEKAILIWNKHYKYVFYFYTIAFALMHLMNFPFSKTILLLTPFIVLPQFILGILTGYLRVKFGFLWGLLLHILNNVIFLIVPILFITNTEKINITNQDYDILIVENNGININSSSNYGNKNITIDNASFVRIISSLEKVQKKLIIVPEELSTLKLNIDFKQKNPEIDNRKIILHSIIDAYNLKIDKEIKDIKAYSVNIFDSVLLSSFENKSDNYNISSSYSRKKLTIDNATITALCNIINNQYSCFTEYIGVNSQRFNFELPVNNFDELKNNLLNNYGLIIKDTTLKKEHIIISKQ